MAAMCWGRHFGADVIPIDVVAVSCCRSCGLERSEEEVVFGLTRREIEGASERVKWFISAVLLQ